MTGQNAFLWHSPDERRLWHHTGDTKLCPGECMVQNKSWTYGKERHLFQSGVINPRASVVSAKGFPSSHLQGWHSPSIMTEEHPDLPKTLKFQLQLVFIPWGCTEDTVIQHIIQKYFTTTFTRHPPSLSHQTAKHSGRNTTFSFIRRWKDFYQKETKSNNGSRVTER